MLFFKPVVKAFCYLFSIGSKIFLHTRRDIDNCEVIFFIKSKKNAAQPLIEKFRFLVAEPFGFANLLRSIRFADVVINNTKDANYL